MPTGWMNFCGRSFGLARRGGILKLVGVCGQEFEMNYADDRMLGCSADGVGCDG
jgi:hypothetical protein